MGVQGLWELLSPVGRPVTLESLENKILAVDVSIWLNQAIKGIRDRKGESVPNSHLLSIFHKICKLLFYKIKPVFVFDGSVPLLKKQTLLARQAQRHIAADKAKKTQHNILKNYIIRSLKSQKCLPSAGKIKPNELPDKIKNKAASSSNAASNDMYYIPLLQNSAVSHDENEINIESESDEEINNTYNDYVMKNFQNPASIDFEAEAFKLLPLEIQHELLNTIKETHKRRYCIQQEDMPEEYQDFSHYQMNRLLHRRKIQKRLEEIEKDINSKHTASLDEIYKSYTNLENANVEARRVMSDESSHFIFVKHKSKKSEVMPDTAEQTETSTACFPEEGKELTYAEIEVNDLEDQVTSAVSSNAVENNGVRVNMLESNIDYVVSDKSGDKKHPHKEINVESDSNTQIQSKYNNSRQESSIKSFNHTASGTLTVPQTETSETAKPSTVSDISTNIEIPALCTDATTDTRNDDLWHKGCTSAYVERELTEDENEESKFLEKENNIYSQDSTAGMYQLEEELHQGSITKNDTVDHSDTITINITQDQSHDDELFEVEELEGTAENVTTERNEEIKYSYLWEAQDNVSLIEELETLHKEKQNQERRALTISEHMYEETKELLKLFGVPYINSPTEAEAQCAVLDMLNLTNGTITDDSDIWLFGGRYVYKNFFSKNKYVEFFKHTDIQSHFNLDRLKLIALAMLTGSDYTQGIQGIGPVTAMEILSEFSGEGIKILQHFKKWWDDFQKHKELPKNAVCAKLAKFHLDDGFPSEVVFDAYLHPAIDESAELFSWGHPDLDQLREFTQEKFGWDQKKTDDLLLPVMKKLNENQLQMRIDSFFQVELKKCEDPLASKRLKQAIKKMHSHEIPTNAISKSTNKRLRKQKRGRKQTNKRSLVTSAKQHKLILSEESSSDS